jgi:hypothetical protein
MNDENQVPREDFVGRKHELIIEPGRTERQYWRCLRTSMSVNQLGAGSSGPM